MASAPFAIEGDGEINPPDVGLDPSIASLPPDPFGDIGLAPPIAPLPPDFTYQGPGLSPSTGQVLVGPGISPSSDANPFGANSTTSNLSAPSLLNDILGIGKLGLGVFATAKSAASTTTGQTGQSKPISTAKVTAGTSSGLVWLALLGFIGIVLWLEFKSDH